MDCCWSLQTLQEVVFFYTFYAMWLLPFSCIFAEMGHKKIQTAVMADLLEYNYIFKWSYTTKKSKFIQKITLFLEEKVCA